MEALTEQNKEFLDTLMPSQSVDKFHMVSLEARIKLGDCYVRTLTDFAKMDDSTIDLFAFKPEDCQKLHEIHAILVSRFLPDLQGA